MTTTIMATTMITTTIITTTIERSVALCFEGRPSGRPLHMEGPACAGSALR